jgi:hypothetical protein
MLNILSDMTRATLHARLICLGVITTLFCGISQPAWAQDEPEEPTGESDYKDPTIVTDDSTSVPDGVKDLGKKDHKPIADPVYNKWWFWVATVAGAGLVATLAVLPLQKKAPGCVSSNYPLGCTGDGR